MFLKIFAYASACASKIPVNFTISSIKIASIIGYVFDWIGLGNYNMGGRAAPGAGSMVFPYAGNSS